MSSGGQAQPSPFPVDESRVASDEHDEEAGQEHRVHPVRGQPEAVRQQLVHDPGGEGGGGHRPSPLTTLRDTHVAG
jgi:hypothetical protein